jgi:TnpA family transposase
MAKRKTLLSDAQRMRFFTLPASGGEIIQHYTLHEDDLKLINRRRRPHNRFGFAVELCLMRYPGRALGSGEVPPAHIVAFIADQLGLTIDLMHDYGR